MYAPIDEVNDFGQVHVNSGIPNKAFYLAASAFGGFAWEKAGKIWWQAIQSGKIQPRCTFVEFASITIDCAQSFGGNAAATIVHQAWTDVGVIGTDK